MSRPRKHENRSLPMNLYTACKDNQVLYRYRHPVTKQYHGMGSNKTKAINAAKILNGELMPSSDLVDCVLNQKTKKFGEHLDHMENFWKEENAAGDLADCTIKDYLICLNTIRTCFADKSANELSVSMVQQFIEGFTPGSAKKYRSLLKAIFKRAVARGYAKENYADQALSVKYKRSRQRLTLDDYDTIYKYAKPYIQNAMDLFLHTTQRPGDLVLLPRPTLEGEDYVFKVVQQKTKKHGKSAYLDMKISGTLKKIVRRCQDDVLSEYLLHYPITHSKRYRGKGLTVDALSRGFKEARDIAIEKEGLFSGLDKKKLPSFYEIRSLGIYLYDRTDKDAQKLAGHKNRAMTEGYLQGHPIQFTEVEAGLDMDRIRELNKAGLLS